MGGFYGSVQIRGEDREPVRAALESLAGRGRRFLLGPPLGGWIGVYPEGSGQDFGLARELASRLAGELIAVCVHDDDIFAYEYFRDGRRLDRYNSCPDYFGDEVSAKERDRLRGRPARIAHLASDPSRFAAICERLAAQDEQREVFASDLLGDFAEALGIRNAMTSYEYLHRNEETEGIEDWDRFVHVPDLGPEKARKRREEEAIVEEKVRLAEQGVLLAERGGLRGPTSPAPWLCPSPDGRGFLVAWSGHADPNEGPLPVERHGPPWPAGIEATPWTIGRHVYGLELSPTGRYLAVAHAAGDWRATLWDLSDYRLIASVPQVRAVSCVGFLPDESAMFSVSSHGDEGQVILAPIGDGDERVIPLPQAKLAAAHPSGEWLVLIDQLNRLLVADAASGRILRVRYVGGRSASDPRERRFFQGSEPTERGASIAGPGATDRGLEGVFRARFDPSGEWLGLGTMSGARAYPWREVLDHDGDLRRPARAVDVAGTTIEAGPGSVRLGGYVYDLDFDPHRARLVFGGLEGRVRFLDLDSGDSGILIDPPARPPIHRLALSRDGSALALVVAPDRLDQGRNRRGPIVQFWDYARIRG